MTAGRPTKYDSTIPGKAEDYLRENEDSVEVVGTGTVLRTVNLPTIEGFASYLGVTKSTVYKWAGDHKKFSDSLELIKAEQLRRLVNSGLSGAYNSTIAKLMLSSNHGIHEKAVINASVREMTHEEWVESLK